MADKKLSETLREYALQLHDRGDLVAGLAIGNIANQAAELEQRAEKAEQRLAALAHRMQWTYDTETGEHVSAIRMKQHHSRLTDRADHIIALEDTLDRARKQEPSQ